MHHEVSVISELTNQETALATVKVLFPIRQERTSTVFTSVSKSTNQMRVCACVCFRHSSHCSNYTNRSGNLLHSYFITFTSFYLILCLFFCILIHSVNSETVKCSIFLITHQRKKKEFLCFGHGCVLDVLGRCLSCSCGREIMKGSFLTTSLGKKLISPIRI